MKKILLVFTILFMCTCFLLLNSCGNSSGSSSDQYTEVSAIDLLSSEELEVYNSIKNSLTSFKNPSSVSVRSVSEEPLIGGRYVTIAAENGFGGTSVSVYQCNGGLRSADGYTFTPDSSISVSKINNALNEYKKSMGW